ncbi:MAG TPA: 50S ribosome-binding GTPase [Candidatus Fimimorpha faecalis]|uniref:50S ribosome-binding GTPase n=1 Tax=Candidatus Fimimorpha faecalis TaxID=2840824 RepID=A0A9D1JDB3_9FIRM|nr:50S ribosome-binding GTPase [Candidatus Fimimorpha faecalis]
MEINTEQIAQQCVNVISSRMKNLKKLNIIVTGKSGVGKSTLINSLFRENLLETGVGRPVTLKIRKIEKEKYPLVIYDTPGFELSKEQQNSVKDEIIKIINDGIESRDINKAIHCVWYCINVGGNRTFDSSEVEWLKNFTENNKKTQVPIIIILTQAYPRSKAKKMKELVEKENLDIVKVVPVLAQDMNFDDEYVARAYGLEKLIDVMSEVLPNELQETLQNVQKASLDAKKRYAQAAVATTVAASFGAGFAPIPFSDSAILIPTQVTMIATITAIFGLDINKSFLTSFISSTIGTAGTTVLGRTVVSNLLKLIPGFGTAVGGMISGSTAGILTTALGEAYIKVMELIYKGELKQEDLYSQSGQGELNRIFKEELKK